MSTLDSSSTLAEIKASYADNASYREDDSAAKAAAFVTACRLLLLKIPAAIAQGDDKTEFDPAVLQNELQAAQQWHAQKQLTVNGCGIVHPSFEYFRD